MKTAADIMTTPVVHVTPSTSIEAAARLMLQQRVSGLPVVDATDALVGMLTEGDLLRRVEIETVPGHSRWQELFGSMGKAAREFVHTHSRRVGEIMTPNVLSVAPDTPLADVVALMEKHNIKRAPVVHNGRMIGIVSRANLVAALVDNITLAHLADAVLTAGSGSASDAALKQNILRTIRAEFWAPSGTVDLAVRDGVVELTGIIFNPDERQALRVAVENVPGVKSVVDSLAWIEPITGTMISPGEGRS